MLNVSVDSPCHGQWINHGVLNVSVTGPTTGLSNPCLDTQRLLCLVMYCSRGGEIGTESHRANYDCTVRVSVTVLASSAVQSFDNGLLKW